MSVKTDEILKRQQAKALRLLSRPNGSTKRYSKYLSQGDQPTDKRNNARNFFDDSNSEDKKWLKVTMEYLSRLR
ncbi:MAG: hypothetical protein ACR2FM_01005 [Candidatus Saccharimonadales bacterium]